MKQFTISLVTAVGYFYDWRQKQGRDDRLSVICMDGFHLDHIRNKLVATALEGEQTHLLFMDADMYFPQDFIVKMIKDFEDNPEVEAITGLYTWKVPPYLPHVYLSFDKQDKKFRIAAKFPLDQLFKVEGAGAGVLMVKAEVFKRTEQPWFKFGGIDGIDAMGEDLYFCYKAKPIMLCDPTIACQHFHTEARGVNDYIDANGLKRTVTQGFDITPEQTEKIAERQEKNLMSKKELEGLGK